MDHLILFFFFFTEVKLEGKLEYCPRDKLKINTNVIIDKHAGTLVISKKKKPPIFCQNKNNP